MLINTLFSCLFIILTVTCLCSLAHAGAVALSSATFGVGFGEIYLDDVECIGTESQLVNCPHITEHNCGHSEDAGVRCLEGTACTMEIITAL